MVTRLARFTWGSLLWFMRRPPIKRLRRNWIHWVPEHRRARAWEHFRSQERWARRYGLLSLRIIYGFFIVVVAAQLIAAWVYWQEATGGFRPPGIGAP